MKGGVFRTVGAVAAGLCLTIGAPSEVAAHKTSLANIELSVEDNRVGVQWTTSAHDLAVVVGIETDLSTPVARAEFDERQAAIEAYIRERTIIHSDGRSCTASEIFVGYEKLPEQLVINSEFDCPNAPATLTVRYGFYFEVDAQHLCVGQIRYGGRTQEVVFDASFMEVDVNIRTESHAKISWKNFAVYLRFGAEHIFTGYDHILFLLALVILLPSMWGTFKMVTAFTIAHSLTLTLAWFDMVNLPSRIVESAIAFSVAYVALENLLRHRPGRRWVVAGCFGLIHGLGFYAALNALDTSSQNTLLVLFSFNLGVEMGQIAIVLLVYVPLYYAARRPWYPRAATAASLAMFAVAV